MGGASPEGGGGEEGGEGGTNEMAQAQVTQDEDEDEDENVNDPESEEEPEEEFPDTVEKMLESTIYEGEDDAGEPDEDDDTDWDGKPF